MPVSADTLRLLIGAGLDGERLLAVVEAIDRDMRAAPSRDATYIDEQAERRRANDRERKRNVRGMSADGSADIPRNSADANTASPARDITAPAQALIPVGLSIDNPPINSPQESPPPKNSLAVARSSRSGAAELLMEFEGEFWRAWPHKTGKPVALKAFLSARKAGCGLAEILAGVERYVRDKPPDRPWLNPSTFLNQRRWEDQPAPVQTGPPRGDRHGGIAALMRETMDAMRLDDEQRDAKQIAQESGDFGDVLGLPFLPPGGGRG